MVFATAAYAFTAENTVPDSNAGFGEGAISGYTVSNIHYIIDGNDLSQMSFNLSGPVPANIVVSFDGGTNTYSNTTNVVGGCHGDTGDSTKVFCNVVESTSAVTGLNVAAYD
jgi:hypothetical protein